MFEGFEVSSGEINPDLLDSSYPLYFPVDFFFEISFGSIPQQDGMESHVRHRFLHG
jgi:hypothetical protein